MNSREMLLSLIDRYILEEADRRKQYNDNQVMIDLYEEVLKILKGDYQEIKDNSLCISILFDTIYHNDISYEDYQAVYELIQKFRDGSILVRQQKKLADNKNTSNAIELVHDQVRVVIRHVKDNIYCVMGVFAKKATNKRETYDKLRNRMIPDISNKDLFDRERELDEYNDKQLEELVVTKARKGTR